MHVKNWKKDFSNQVKVRYKDQGHDEDKLDNCEDQKDWFIEKKIWRKMIAEILISEMKTAGTIAIRIPHEKTMTVIIKAT